jgi:hypothetical protein
MKVKDITSKIFHRGTPVIIYEWMKEVYAGKSDQMNADNCVYWDRTINTIQPEDNSIKINIKPL